MSMILTLTGRTSTLSVNLATPIQLDPDSEYGLALLSFHSYNCIPNIEKGQKFYLYNEKKEKKVIEFPAGAYEISDIERFIVNNLNAAGIRNNSIDDGVLSLKPNNNTITCEIFSNKYWIDFRPKDSIGGILGFSKERFLEPNKLHTSDLPVNIIKVRTIHVDCNITSGSFYNGRPSHTIYEFAVAVDPGFAIDETPRHLVYLPINNKLEVHNITINLLDQNFERINFKGEEIIIVLELKKLS